jgi:CrcB protein
VTWALVIVGAMLGAPVRYLIDRGVQDTHDGVFPWGTFTANVLGCLLLGVLVGSALHGSVPPSTQALAGVGFCGAVTTYSTFGYESMRLAQTGARFLAVLNVTMSLTAGLGAYLVGLMLANAWWRAG